MAVGFKSILVISDQHFPYNHVDTIAFLAAIKAKYSPDKVVNIGDEIDGHSLSFHEKSAELLSPSDELQTAINRMQPLYKLYPDMDIVESNHGSLVYRRARYAGLPVRVIKEYRDVLEAPKGWKWYNDLIVKMSNGMSCYFCHGKSSDVLRLSQSMGMSCVQGHFHEKFEIRYWGNKLGLFWGMTVGCLVDDHSLAFSYNKLNLRRPVIGCAIILNGIPRLLPMVLKKNGRWDGSLS